jgi:hypothetical protein
MNHRIHAKRITTVRTGFLFLMEPPFKSRLDAIVKNPDNSLCADCSARQPRWSSVKLGILICANCAGIHRKLGTHISFVQSVTIDRWKAEWVDLCEKIGNRISNMYYEANIPSHLTKPTPATDGGSGGDTMDATTASRLEKWLRNKYQLKLFVVPDSVSPADLIVQGISPEKVYLSPKKKEKKKKKERRNSDDTSPVSQTSPVSSAPVILLPDSADWKSNIFLRSWAQSMGVSVD